MLFFDSMFSPWKGGRSRGARAFTHILTQLSNFLDLKEDINAPWSLLSGNSQFRRIDEELTQSSYAHNTALAISHALILVVHNSTFKSFETRLSRGRLRLLNQPENRRDQTVTSVVVAWDGRMTFTAFQVGKLGH